jgi:hypothetical protein
MKKILSYSALLAASALILPGCGGVFSSSSPKLGKIGVWTTTNVKSGTVYVQQDRLSNPVVNEVFATFANDRHRVNNLATPDQDSTNLSTDIQSFMTDVAGRSQATTDVVKAVFAQDVMVVDLTSTATKAAYLGVQTNGATGSTFGGRELTDDVVDMSLGVVFGSTISALGLAPDDGKQIPTLTSDNVGSGGKQFTNTFPYLGAPR